MKIRAYVTNQYGQQSNVAYFGDELSPFAFIFVSPAANVPFHNGLALADQEYGVTGGDAIAAAGSSIEMEFATNSHIRVLDDPMGDARDIIPADSTFIRPGSTNDQLTGEESILSVVGDFLEFSGNAGQAQSFKTPDGTSLPNLEARFMLRNHDTTTGWNYYSADGTDPLDPWNLNNMAGPDDTIELTQEMFDSNVSAGTSWGFLRVYAILYDTVNNVAQSSHNYLQRSPWDTDYNGLSEPIVKVCIHQTEAEYQAQADPDSDGVSWSYDAFPNDPNEDSDADNDGYGDNLEMSVGTAENPKPTLRFRRSRCPLRGYTYSSRIDNDFRLCPNN